MPGVLIDRLAWDRRAITGLEYALIGSMLAVVIVCAATYLDNEIGRLLAALARAIGNR